MTAERTTTVGSLFSGIGGIDLGLERAGMSVVWQAEIDPYACRVLAKHWPNVPNHGDVTTIDWSGVERPDLICGGYPCQPFSLAGARAGDDDTRHLWPHMLTAIRHLRPRWALLENVPGHLSLGFGRVLGDLAESGYDAEWDCIPAAAVGAPHRRDRIFIVAHADGARLERPRLRESEKERVGRGRPLNGSGAVADAGHQSNQAQSARSGTGRTGRSQGGPGNSSGCRGRCFRPKPVGGWAVEPDVGRVAHGVPARVDRLRALGNAVVPQVAEWVGRRILEAS